MYEELVKRLRQLANEQMYDFERKPYLQAADAIEELSKTAQKWELEAAALQTDHEYLIDENRKLVAAWQNALDLRNRWISVEEKLPKNNVHVLLSCKFGAGAYVCDGFHTEKYSTPTLFYEDIDADYDEDTDEYYFPEGWWEVIKNWDDYSCVAIEDEVTHWMPLPEPPKEEDV